MSETPDRIAIDADGFGWRVWDDQEHWSMVPTNPDNEPVPHPLTWYVRFGYAANGGTLDADRIVNDAFHQQYADRSFPFEPRAVTADLKAAAGLEGDGLVVLRYEGDAVTVAGRLEEKPIQWVADEPMPTLYQIVETGNPWGISTLESQPVVPHRCQACFGTRRGQYEETCWKCKGTGLLFRGATSPTPSIQPTAPPSPRSAQ
jgi:hypothetical protein